jgi:putative ABC transport system permease protein
MGIEMLHGRAIRQADDERSPGVLVINETLAERFFPNENAVGKRLTMGSGAANVEWLTIVGVARNAAQSDWAAAPAEELYLPYLQNQGYLAGPSLNRAYLTLVLRVAGDAERFAGPTRQAIHEIDPNVIVSQVATMEHVVRNATAPWRLNLMLLGSFAGVALALAAIGIYGVMSYSVAQRTHEIGIRLALGARRAAVLNLIMRQTLLLVGTGAAAGLTGAFLLTRLMTSMLFGVPATDPATFAVALALLSAVALGATCIPALRVMRRDPLNALRAR